MKNRFLTLSFLTLLAAAAQAAPLGTGFTYQGRLNDGGVPANGLYDFNFKLYDVATGGTLIGPAPGVSTNLVAVRNGLFDVYLDFGVVFNGDRRWLEIMVNTNVAHPLSLLVPRQPLHPAPYAIHALKAGMADMATTASGVAPGAVNSASVVDDSIDAADLNPVLRNSTFWRLGGNAGATPATRFLGTTDNQELVLGADNAPILRLVPDNISPNLIGGHRANVVGNLANGSAVLSGGTTVDPNGVSGSRAVIAGGQGNTNFSAFGFLGGGQGNRIIAANNSVLAGGAVNRVEAEGAFLGGGANNVNAGTRAFLGGGDQNTITTGGTVASLGGGSLNRVESLGSTVGGGTQNTVGSSAADGTIAGGFYNSALGFGSTVGGGRLNYNAGSLGYIGGGTVNTNYAGSATIGGGGNNLIEVGAAFSAVSGGRENRAQDLEAVVAGGSYNSALARQSTVSGGSSNSAAGYLSTVGGGLRNTNVAFFSTIGGGSENAVAGFGGFATIGGGEKNFADGRKAVIAGGIANTNTADYASIGGGFGNTASGQDAVVAGGSGNRATAGQSAVGGGVQNRATASQSTVSGGALNNATGVSSTVAGGERNTNSASSGAIGGGSGNRVTGSYAAVPGGRSAVADHYGQLAFAAGHMDRVGDAQASTYVLRRRFSGNGDLTLDPEAGSSGLTVPAGAVWTLRFQISGVSVSGANFGSYEVSGVIANIGGVRTFQLMDGSGAVAGTARPIFETAGAAGWLATPYLNADGTLRVAVFAGETVKWCARIDVCEVTR